MMSPAPECSPAIVEILRQTQRQLEQLYELEAGPDINDFVRFKDDQACETVLVKQAASAVEVVLLLPTGLDVSSRGLTDDHLQLIEGVSHFVLLAERARMELPATRLELEIQAEVDKFALLVACTEATTEKALWRLHHWLFEQVSFIHAANTECGERYRTANDVAARLCAQLTPKRNGSAAHALLKRFYRSGQTEKIRLALAA
jgi:hypothetical protein